MGILHKSIRGVHKSLIACVAKKTLLTALMAIFEFIRDGTTGGRRTGGPGWWFVTEAIMPHVSLIRL